MASVTFDRPLFRRISWGALFAGFFVGFGMWLLLLALGAGIGLAAFNPRDLSNWQALGIGFGIWGVIAGIVSLFVAGWCAARLSGCAEKIEGALHGFALWGFMIVAGLWLASSTVSGIVGGATSAASTAAQAAAQSPEARQEAQQQAQQLQQQATGAIQSADPQQIGQTAADVGTTGAWAFFLFGALTLAAAIFGGSIGVPKNRRVIATEEPVTTGPNRPLTPQRV